MKLPYQVLHPLLSAADWRFAEDKTRGELLRPNVTLAPDGEPYLYRYHLDADNVTGNTFFHIQVKSDPERPLHDHPWDNTSVILRGGYDELYEPYPQHVPAGQDLSTSRTVLFRQLRAGAMVFRTAATAHCLTLPPDTPYTMTKFVTGPKTREWGFWYAGGDWHHNERHVINRADGVSFGRHEK